MTRTMQRTAAVLLVLLCFSALTAWASGAPEGASVSTEAIHITGWANWGPGAVTDNPTFGNLLMFKELEKRFNIFIDWVAVSADAQAALGLLVASGDLPDLIERTFTTDVAQEYGRQGAFIALEGLIARQAPYLTQQMKANPAYKGQTVAADGHIYFFPRLVEPIPRAFPGYQIRKDWLDKLNLKMPDTMADLEVVLKAFRDRDPNGNGQADEIPWATDPRALIWPFGVGSKGYNNATDMFVENKTVKYGPTDPRFKEAIALLSRWYAEKLIDNEYLGQSGSQLNTLVLNDRVGSALGSFAGLLTQWNKLLKGAGKTGVFVGMPAPMGPTGIRSMMGGHMELDPACGAAITSKSKYPEQITRMMDYFYADEGRLLLYFGVEGDTYTMVNGKPVYTDKVAKHPTLAIASYLNTYVGYISQWPSIVPEAHQLALYDQEGKDAIALSSKTMGDRKIPILQFTAAEIKEVQGLLRDLNTYVDESVHAFIRGQKPMGEWNAFQDGLKRLNTERVTAIYQAAYARYLSAAGL